MNLIAEELFAWFINMLSVLPGRIGRVLRISYYRRRFRRAGKSISIGENVDIGCPENISLGDEIYLVRGAVLRSCDSASLVIGSRFAANGNARIVADCGGEIEIGNGVMVGPNAVIRASNHRHDRYDTPIWEQGQTGGRIVIKDDVWIAANAVILPGVVIGSHSIVAAGAVVSHDVPDYVIVGGVPARIIAHRNRA